MNTKGYYAYHRKRRRSQYLDVSSYNKSFVRTEYLYMHSAVLFRNYHLHDTHINNHGTCYLTLYMSSVSRTRKQYQNTPDNSTKHSIV